MARGANADAGRGVPNAPPHVSSLTPFAGWPWLPGTARQPFQPYVVLDFIIYAPVGESPSAELLRVSNIDPLFRYSAWFIAYSLRGGLALGISMQMRCRVWSATIHV